MDITRTDIKILLISLIFVVLMTLTFPAFGLGGESVDEEMTYSDIPSVDIQTDRFNFAGSFPSPPGQQDADRVYISEGDDKLLRLYNESLQITIEHDEEDDIFDIEIFLYDQSGVAHGGDSDELINDVNEHLTLRHEYPDPNEFPTDMEGAYQVEFTPNHPSIRGGEVVIPIDYKIQEFANIIDDGDTSGITGFIRVYIENHNALGPIWALFASIGEATGVGGAIAGLMLTMRYFADIVMWGISTLIQVFMNLLFILIDASTFIFELIWFLLVTQLEILSILPPTVALLYSIPVIALYIVTAKMLYVGIKILPTT